MLKKKFVPAMNGAFVIAYQFVPIAWLADCSSQPAALVGQKSVASNETGHRLGAMIRCKGA